MSEIDALSSIPCELFQISMYYCWKRDSDISRPHPATVFSPMSLGLGEFCSNDELVSNFSLVFID